MIVGAFVAAAVVYLTYREGLTAFDGGVRQVLGPQGTAGIFATYPQPYLTTFPGGFIDQVVGTAILIAVIFGITDQRNAPAPAGLTLLRADATPPARAKEAAEAVMAVWKPTPQHKMILNLPDTVEVAGKTLRFKKAVIATGALEYARSAARREARLAADAIVGISDSHYRKSLIDLAAFSVSRDY